MCTNLVIDYLHLTKRCGIVAASQFPLQYILALKIINPVAFAFGSSHEQLNRWHRLLGRIVTFLLFLHGALYMNYFIAIGIVMRRTTSLVVAVGIVAFVGILVMDSTAIRITRRYSYRVFFVTHFLVAFLLPIALFFHTRQTRFYLGQAFFFFMLDLVWRKVETTKSQAVIESIPGTNLIKISAPMPITKANRYRERPGSHIYLSIPAAARHSPNPASASYLLFEFLFNPFTVASVDQDTGDLTLVARHRNGPVTVALARFAEVHPHSASSGNLVTNEEGKIPLGIEGPYGAVSNFQGLVSGKYNRVLLVAGGVGATFTVPLYRALIHDNPNVKVEMTWAVRGAGDATWAVAGEDSKSILEDHNVHIFLTGDIVDPPDGSDDMSQDGEVEMSAMYRDRRRNKFTSQHNRRRPDLKKIVDDTFRHGSEERVAVVVCGPSDMARELRKHVGPWVASGRTVWWHNETFGW